MSFITMTGLGQSGGLCSQLQTYASLAAVAKANNKRIVFTQESVEGDLVKYHTGEYYQTNIRILDLLDIDYEIVPKSFIESFDSKHINYHTTTYDETLFNLDASINYNLVGRFDLYTYWYNSIGDEVAEWKFKSNLQQQAEKRMERIQETFGNNNPTVSLHVRRGDYLLPNHHFAILDNDYYETAIIKHFWHPAEYNFVVFSNDIEYCRNMIDGDNVYFVEPDGGEKVCSDSEKEDLVLLSLCDHHIIANSSYSWWAAYLCKNKNKKIICPTNWLKAYHPSSWINGRYYPSNWINIDNIA